MSIRLRMIVSVDFHLSSYDLKPQVSFIVMQLSQSTPGKPLAGICCSGVPKSPDVFAVGLAQPLHSLAALADAVVDDDVGLQAAHIGVQILPSSSVHQSQPLAVEPRARPDRNS